MARYLLQNLRLNTRKPQLINIYAAKQHLRYVKLIYVTDNTQIGASCVWKHILVIICFCGQLVYLYFTVDSKEGPMNFTNRNKFCRRKYAKQFCQLWKQLHLETDMFSPVEIKSPQSLSSGIKNKLDLCGSEKIVL